MNKYKKLAIIAGSILILDQITKAVVFSSISLHQMIPVIPGFFDLTHIHNTGGAFGVFADSSPVLRKFIFLFVSSLAACAILYFYRQTPDKYRFLSAAWASVFGGAVGNLIDRAFRDGKVVDFLDFQIMGWHWPAFNVADSAITIGMAVVVFHLIFNKMPE